MSDNIQPPLSAATTNTDDHHFIAGGQSPIEMPTYRWRESAGLTQIECNWATWGPGTIAYLMHGYSASLNPATSLQVLPSSRKRNRPGGEVPAWQTLGSESGAAASQNTAST